MKRTYRNLLALLLAIGLLLAGCGSGVEQEPNDYELGQRVATHWFAFAVEEARVADSYNGYLAPEGNRLVICTMVLQNTFDEAVPMNQGDFVLVWEREEGDASASDYDVAGAYAMAQYSVKQLPDEYTLELGEAQEGTLVFVVPDAIDRAAVRFQEYYADGENGSSYVLGDSYQVWLDL